jgi:AraC-like DNA-binding protein
MTEVRAAALTNYDHVARFLGLDPDALLREFGIDPVVLHDPEQPIPVATVARLLEESAARACCEQFGLLMAESRSLASIGPAALLLAHEPTAGDAIDALIRHQRMFGLALDLRKEDAGDVILVRAELHGTPVMRQGSELLVGLIYRCIDAVVGGRWKPEMVHFTHSAPADNRVHQRVFRCPIEFDSSFNGFTCDRAALSAENPVGDAELAHHAERFLQLLIPTAGTPSARERVLRALRLHLPEGRGSLEQVAHNLCMTPRTLQRLLEREKCGFADLLNEVRRELAQRYLSELSRPISTISQQVGFQTPTSFTRWFAAEFGTSPAAWRAQGRAS